MSHNTTGLSRLRDHWNQFFFTKQVPYGIALTRICLSGVMLVEMGRRWPYVRELFSLDGAPAPIAASYGYPDMLPILPAPAAVALYTVLLSLLLTLMIGWKSRISAAGVFVLFTYFTLQDSLSTLTKYSVISSHVFLLLSLSQCGAVWSVDRWLERKKLGVTNAFAGLSTGRAVEIWPQRLIQIFIAIVYFGAAVTKMQTKTYFSGDQMRFWLLTDVNHYNPIGEWLSMFPALLIPMSYIAIIWEVTFLFMVWRTGWRVPFLLIGAVFHLLTTLTLGLYVFPLVCMSIYLSFVTPADVAWWRVFVARRWPRWIRLANIIDAPARWCVNSVTSLARTGTLGFATGLLALTAISLMTERAMNVYAANSNGDRYTLEPMSPELAQRMLTGDTVIRQQDKVFSFDVGQYQVGGLVIETGRQFQLGQTIYAQVNLVPPHGDLYLECNLASERGLVHGQTSGIVTREEFRYTFSYTIPETYEPGTYQFLLKINNEEVARRTIELVSQ